MQGLLEVDRGPTRVKRQKSHRVYFATELCRRVEGTLEYATSHVPGHRYRHANVLVAHTY